MRTTYRGHTIEVERASSMTGTEHLFWSVIREEDGLICAEGRSDPAERVRDEVRFLKELVDEELDRAVPWEDVA